MAQFEQTQILDKVQPLQQTPVDSHTSDRDTYKYASQVFKQITDAAKSAVNLHDFHLTNDAEGHERSLQGGKGATDGGDKATSSTTDKPADGKLQNDAGAQGQPPQNDSGKSGSAADVRMMSEPTVPVYEPGSTNRDHRGLVHTIGELPKPPALPGGAVIIKP